MCVCERENGRAWMQSASMLAHSLSHTHTFTPPSSLSSSPTLASWQHVCVHRRLHEHCAHAVYFFAFFLTVLFFFLNSSLLMTASPPTPSSSTFFIIALSRNANASLSKDGRDDVIFDVASDTIP